MCMKLHWESLSGFCSTLSHIQEWIKRLVMLLEYEKAEETWEVQKRVTDWSQNANVDRGVNELCINCENSLSDERFLL